MNAITRPSPTHAASMTSKEIAELTGKDHKDVLRDIRVMLAALGKGERSFASSYKSAQNKTLPMLVLPKDLTLTLVSGYSIPMRHRIVTRWQELEAAQAALPRRISDLPRNSQIPGPVLRVLQDAKRIGHSIEDVMGTLTDVMCLASQS